MQFQILNFREGGYASIFCDCGAEFFEATEAISHVIDEHCTDEQCQSENLTLARIALLLSPNPIFLNGGSQCRQETPRA
jgi:hypothetical protein